MAIQIASEYLWSLERDGPNISKEVFLMKNTNTFLEAWTNSPLVPISSLKNGWKKDIRELLARSAGKAITRRLCSLKTLSVI